MRHAYTSHEDKSKYVTTQGEVLIPSSKGRDLAHRLRRVIEALHGGSVNAAAMAIPMRQQTLAKIVSGQAKSPRFETVQQIADYYGGSLDWWMSGKGEPPNALSKKTPPRVVEGGQSENMIPQTEDRLWSHTVSKLAPSSALELLLENLPSEPLWVAERAGFFHAYPHRVVVPYPAPPAIDMLREASRLHYEAWTAWLRFWIDKLGVRKTRELLEENLSAIPASVVIREEVENLTRSPRGLRKRRPKTRGK